MFLPISQNLSPRQLIVTELKFSGRLVWLLDEDVDAGRDAGDGESAGQDEDGVVKQATSVSNSCKNWKLKEKKTIIQQMIHKKI